MISPSSRRDIHPRQAFEESVRVSDGCWEWQGPIATTGYGTFPWEGRREYAHRIAWTLIHGEEIPAGMVVRHTCDNPPCVRPDHLLIGTKAENSRDMVERGRSTRKTHCIRGHALTPENRYQRPDRPGKSDCLLCNRLRASRQRRAA